jgi:putative hemolysin
MPAPNTQSKQAPEVDPAFAAYLRDEPKITYVQPDDPWLTRQLISTVERLFGRRQIEDIYHNLKRGPFDVHSFFALAFEKTNIERRYDSTKLKTIPRTGPLVFVANHPFGIVDGMALCDMALQARGDFRILINSLLCQDKDLAPYFLPIDFSPTKEALKNNIRVKKVAQDCLADNIPILIFPSGFVSTADKKGFGDVVDAPWTTFAAKLIRDAQASVLPVYFPGQNRRAFHLASHIAEPLRMALLLSEARNRFDKPLEAVIGNTLEWEKLSRFENRQALTNHLYQQVQALAQQTSEDVT